MFGVDEVDVGDVVEEGVHLQSAQRRDGDTYARVEPVPSAVVGDDGCRGDNLHPIVEREACQEGGVAVEADILGFEDIANLGQGAVEFAVEMETGAEAFGEMEETADIHFGGNRGPVVFSVDGFVFGQRGKRVNELLRKGGVERAAVHHIADIDAGEGETVVFASRDDAFHVFVPMDAGAEVDDACRHLEEVGGIADAKVEIQTVVMREIGFDFVGFLSVFVSCLFENRGVVEVEVDDAGDGGIVFGGVESAGGSRGGEVEIADEEFGAGADGDVVVDVVAEAEGGFTVYARRSQAAVEQLDVVVAHVAIVAFVQEGDDAFRQCKTEVHLGLSGDGDEELVEVEAQANGVDVEAQTDVAVVGEGVEDVVGVDIRLAGGRVVLEDAAVSQRADEVGVDARQRDIGSGVGREESGVDAVHQGVARRSVEYAAGLRHAIEGQGETGSENGDFDEIESVTFHWAPPFDVSVESWLKSISMT